MTQSNPARPLSALLSQILIAYTVEVDNEFELKMSAAGHPGARLSLVIWLNLIRFIPKESITVRELTVLALAPQVRIKFQLGCLERWGIVTLHSDSGVPRTPMLDGWGSGRGVNTRWSTRLTAAGTRAAQIWPPLLKTIETRWHKRFGDDFEQLLKCLRDVVEQIGLELPQGLADVRELKASFPARKPSPENSPPLPVLLSQLLTIFALNFEPASAAPLALCANVLRALGENSIPVSDLSRLTGCSPEIAAIGWQLKPFVVVEPNKGGGRGKVVRLSPRGAAARQNYHRLVGEIENQWQKRFGKETIGNLRESLESLLNAEHGDHSLLSEGLAPPSGTVRAGDAAPALGRRDLGAAAKQRARDLVAQTQAFFADPAAALPHFPQWDMNRGFGP